MTNWPLAALLASVLALLWPGRRILLQRRLRQAALLSEKNGLLAFTQWTQLAAHELATTARRGGQLAVLMISLDRDHRRNDRHDHHTDEALMRAAAAVIRTHTRRHDLLSQNGDDKLIVLLSAIDTDDLKPIADRIRSHVTELAVTVPTSPEPVTGLSVSIGAAIYPTDGDTIDGLLLTADVLLVAAQHGGRNQIRFARHSRLEGRP